MPMQTPDESQTMEGVWIREGEKDLEPQGQPFSKMVVSIGWFQIFT